MKSENPLWDFNKKAKREEKIQFLIDNAYYRIEHGTKEPFDNKSRSLQWLRKENNKELDLRLKLYNIDIEEGFEGNTDGFTNEGILKRMNTITKKMNNYVKSFNFANILTTTDLQQVFNQYDTWAYYSKEKPFPMSVELSALYEIAEKKLFKDLDEFSKDVLGYKVGYNRKALDLKESGEYFLINKKMIDDLMELLKKNTYNVKTFLSTLYLPYDYKKYKEGDYEGKQDYQRRWDEKSNEIKKGHFDELQLNYRNSINNENFNLIPRFNEFINS